MIDQYNYLWDVDNPLTYKNRMGFYKTKIELSFIKKNIPDHINLKILDVGGGAGRFAISLNKEGHDVTVIDFSQAAITQCRRLGLQKALWINVLEFQSLEKYDLAIAIEVIDYLDNFSLLLNKVKELSNDKIKLIFTIHNKNSWRFRIREFKKDRTPYNKYYLKDYINDLNNCGFKIIEIKGFLWMPFTVASNSRLIPLFEKLEIFLKLNKWIKQSPWLLIAVERI